MSVFYKTEDNMGYIKAFEYRLYINIQARNYTKFRAW